MSKFVYTSCRIYSGGADLSGQSNKIELSAEHEDKDTTNFDSNGWRECRAGLAKSEGMGSGQWEAGDTSKVDDAQWAALGGLGALSVCPIDANAGSLAWLTYAMSGSFMVGGTVGDVAPWEVKFKGSWPLVRGVSLHPPGTARTASGNGSAVLALPVTGVPSGQYLYAALHVLSVSGTTPSLTVKVQSDVDNTFASPADQITFSAASARGGQIQRVAGPITDTYYRVNYTISGTNPSFLFVVTVGAK